MWEVLKSSASLLAHEHDTPRRPPDLFPFNHLRLVNLPLKISENPDPKEKQYVDTTHIHNITQTRPHFNRHSKSSIQPFYTFASKAYIALNFVVVVVLFWNIICGEMLRNGWDLKRDVYGIQIAVTYRTEGLSMQPILLV